MPKRRPVLSFIILLFMILSLSGCSIKLPKLLHKETPISNLPAEALFIDKEAIYNQTLRLLQSAKKSIYVEQAEFDDPQLIQLLISKARAGVEVRVLMDQWQKVNRATLDQLKSQNVSVQFYPAQKGQTDNVKYLVVDQNQALIYGPAWTAKDLQAHDLAVALTGKSAWKTASLFARDWEFTTTLPLNVPKTSTLPDDNIILATNANVKQQLTDQIASSTKTIWIEVTEITDPDTVQSLLDVAEKGREVRLIVDPTIASKTPVTIEKLKSKGVQIRYYPSQTPLGMQLAIFDNDTFLLSSSGWTHYSFIANHEFSITVPSPTSSAKLGELFKQDWEKSSTTIK